MNWSFLGAVAMALALAFGAAPRPALAQEVSDSHLRAARSAVTAMRVTDPYDDILPQAALMLKGELIQQNPDREREISNAVDQTAIELAARRGDLEREVAMLYARMFSEEELNEVSAFYDSETGRKLIEEGPAVLRRIGFVADIWRRGVSRDLALMATEKLQGIEAPAAVQESPPAGEGAAAN